MYNSAGNMNTTNQKQRGPNKIQCQPIVVNGNILWNPQPTWIYLN